MISILDYTQTLLPNKCASCASSGHKDGRKFVDFGLTIDGYGCVYICVPCFTHGMTLLDFVTGRQYQILKEQFVKLREKFDKIKDENDRLRSILGNVDFLRLNSRDDDLSDLEDVPDISSDGENKSESSESPAKSGSSDVSNNDAPKSKSSSKSDPAFTIKLS